MRGQGPRQVAAAMLNESQYLSSRNKRERSSRALNSLTLASHAVAPQPVLTPHPSQSDADLADFADEPMHIDDKVSQAHILQDVPLRRSTRVTTRAPHIERVRWRSRSPLIESSDSDSVPEEGDDSLSSDNSPDSDSDSDSSSEFAEDNGFLSAWELLGEDFEREAHSLGARIEYPIQCIYSISANCSNSTTRRGRS